jgi:hypothetical protein
MRWLTVVFTVTMALAWVPAAWAAAPALLILSPSSADSGGPAFTLTIVGMNFTSESTAMWGATVLTTTYISDTELSADVPASLIVSTGAASITVTTAGGVSSGISFTINPPSPSISGQRPALAVVNETTVSASLVTVAPAATVPVATAIGITSQSAFDANPPSPSIPDPKPASAVVNESTVSSRSAVVNETTVSTNLVTAAPSIKAQVALAVGFSFQSGLDSNPPLPTISSLSPSGGNAGMGAFILTVVGTNFSSNSTIYWGSTPLVTTVLQSAVAQASVPASLVATVGAISITVFTPSGTSSPVIFNISPAMPVITSMSPGSVAAGSSQFTLTVNGTGFSSISAVFFGSCCLLDPTYASTTQLRITIPAYLIATAGITDIVVYTPYVGFSTAVLYTVNPAPPAITSLTPSSVTAGGAGFMMTVTGTAFTPGATSTWGTTFLGTVYISPTQLIVAVPATLIEFSGAGSVTVTTAEGTSSPAAFTINSAPPAISGLSPASADSGGPTFTLTISGEYFTPTSTAKWGSTALTTTYINQSQLTALVPANLIASAGAASVSVTTPVGTSSSFSVTINPAIKITTTTLPAGTAGNAYSGAINVTGGSPGYTWTVTGLPASLIYSNTSDSTLTVTGTPASSGVITFQVSVQDTVGVIAGPVTYTVNIATGPGNANNGSLNGSYVCLFQGSIDTDGTRWATLASFQADGQGNFTSGILDTNSYDIGSASGTMTGSYDISADNNGMASIHTILTSGAAAIQTTQWAIAISGAAQPAQHFRMIEADDLGTLPSNQQGAANCYLATASAFTASAISGNSFVFALDGEDNEGNMKAAAGFFSASAGKITGGNIDMAQGGNATLQSASFTATYTAPDPASGRFTMALNGAGSSTGFTVYIIDANRMFILDNTSDDGEQAGNMRIMQQTSPTGPGIAGPFVLYMRGAEFSNLGNIPSGYYSEVLQGTGDGAENITIIQSYKDDAGVYSAGNSIGGPVALTYVPSHPGRASFQSAGGTTYLYLFNNNSAFEISVGDNGSLDSGWLESQTQASFTNAALAGNYLFGNLPLLNIEPSSSLGVFSVNGSGAINSALTTASQGNLAWDQSTSMIYGWDATAPGTGTFLIANSSPFLMANNAQGIASCAVINVTRFVCVSQTDPAPSVQLFEQ